MARGYRSVTCAALILSPRPPLSDLNKPRPGVAIRYAFFQTKGGPTLRGKDDGSRDPLTRRGANDSNQR
jgi:hypothetical protein